MPIRPEADRKLRAGFQRHVDQQRARYAAQLAHAGQQAAWFECGDVVGVFTAQAGGEVRPRAYVTGLLPMAAIPILIAAAAVGVPGAVPVLGASPFLIGAWFGVSMWRGRERKRRIWLYAFTGGFMLLDGPRADDAPVRWSQVAEVGEVWTDKYDMRAEEAQPVLSAYRLRCEDGQVHEIPRSLQNVEDPYREVGQLLRGLMPAAAGDALPRFATIDEVIAEHAGR